MRYTYPYLLFFALLIFNSCTQTSDGPEGETADTSEMDDSKSTESEVMGAEEASMGEAEGSDPKDVISLDSANVWSCNFQNFMNGGITSTQWNTIKAEGFFIPEDDVTQLTSLSGVDNLRAYLGLRNDTLKLMFVGVNGSGDDVLTLITDFTTPCPPDCGTNKQITDCSN